MCEVCQRICIRSKPYVLCYCHTPKGPVLQWGGGALCWPPLLTDHSCHSQERFSGGHLNWLGPGVFAGHAACHVTGSVGHALEEYSQVGLCISLTPVLSAAFFSVALC